MKKTFQIPLFLILALPQLGLSQLNLSETRKLASEWVSTQRLISQEKHAWIEDKQQLLDTIELLKEQDEMLAEALNKATQDASTSDAEREKLLSRKAELAKAEKVTKSVLSIQESRIRELVEWLPAPLKDELSPFLRRLPEDPSLTKEPMTRRLQALIGILTQIDKFNTTVLVEEGSRVLDNNRTIQVYNLYFGLAGGFYVDSLGTLAGVLTPARGGWVAEPRNDLAAELAEAVAVYNKTTSKEARFFLLPIAFQSIGGHDNEQKPRQ